MCCLKRDAEKSNDLKGRSQASPYFKELLIIIKETSIINPGRTVYNNVNIRLLLGEFFLQ